MSLEEMMDQNGYYIDKVKGEDRYVTTNERDRAVVGPRRHAAKGLFGRMRKRRAGRVANSNAETVEVPLGAMPDTGLVAKVRWYVLSKFYDEHWHKAVQHTAVDVMIWAVGLSVSAVFIRGAWWVIGL